MMLLVKRRSFSEGCSEAEPGAVGRPLLLASASLDAHQISNVQLFNRNRKPHMGMKSGGNGR